MKTKVFRDIIFMYIYEYREIRYDIHTISQMDPPFSHSFRVAFLTFQYSSSLWTSPSSKSFAQASSLVIIVYTVSLSRYCCAKIICQPCKVVFLFVKASREEMSQIMGTLLLAATFAFSQRLFISVHIFLRSSGLPFLERKILPALIFCFRQ